MLHDRSVEGTQVFSGRRISFCTRQLFMSATKSTSSDGHAMPWIQLNCPRLVARLAEHADNLPVERQLVDAARLLVGRVEILRRALVMQIVQGCVSSGGFAFRLPRTG